VEKPLAILLVVIAALAMGDAQCPETHGVPNCAAPQLMLADASGDVLSRDDLGHIADVVPPSQRGAKAAPPQPATSPAPAPRAGPPEPTARAEPPAAEEPASSPGPVPAAAATEDGWVVQVAAFENRAAAERGVGRIGLENLTVVPTRRNGEDWYVVLLGTYPSRQQADDSGRAYAEASGGSYWVRRASELQAIRRGGGD
jgi:septal ring-binding cell division protein DamX